MRSEGGGTVFATFWPRAFATMFAWRRAMVIGDSSCLLGGVWRCTIGICGGRVAWMALCRWDWWRGRRMGGTVVVFEGGVLRGWSCAIRIGYRSRAMPRHVLSCQVRSGQVRSGQVRSCEDMSCHVMSRHVMSCHVMSCHVLSCHVV